MRGQTGRSPVFLPIWEAPAQLVSYLLRKPIRFCYVSGMARWPRVVVVDVPHHVTQRGNTRQVILASDADRLTYLELLREYAG